MGHNFSRIPEEVGHGIGLTKDWAVGVKYKTSQLYREKTGTDHLRHGDVLYQTMFPEVQIMAKNENKEERDGDTRYIEQHGDTLKDCSAHFHSCINSEGVLKNGIEIREPDEKNPAKDKRTLVIYFTEEVQNKKWFNNDKFNLYSGNHSYREKDAGILKIMGEDGQVGRTFEVFFQVLD